MLASAVLVATRLKLQVSSPNGNPKVFSSEVLLLCNLVLDFALSLDGPQRVEMPLRDLAA